MGQVLVATSRSINDETMLELIWMNLVTILKETNFERGQIYEFITDKSYETVNSCVYNNFAVSRNKLLFEYWLLHVTMT